MSHFFLVLLTMLFHRHSIFALSCLLKITGNRESKAQTTTIMTDLTDITSPVVVSTYNSTPALMKPNDGGATPTNVPIKKYDNGTPITGEQILINQLGRNGVIRKKMM